MTRTRPTRAEQKDRTREEICRAALDLFEERGFEGTTIDEIAAAASVGRRTFFRYFLCKEAVLFSRGGVFPHLTVNLDELLAAGTPPARALFLAMERKPPEDDEPNETMVRRRELRMALLDEPSVADFYRRQIALMAQAVTDVVRKHPQHAAVPYLPELLGGLIQTMTTEHVASGETQAISVDAEPWRAAIRALELSFDDKPSHL